MHTLLLVVGEDVDRQLDPFSQHLEVAPYEVLIEADELSSMALHYGLATTDLEALVRKVPDYFREEGFLRDRRLGRISTLNPKGKVDFYRIGGQWEGFLRLRTPRRLRRFFELLPAGETVKASQARKSEIDQSALTAEPPASVLFRGNWYASKIFAEGESLDAWRTQFAELLAGVPEDAMLTVVDVHS